VKNLSQDFSKQLRDDANLLKQSNSGTWWVKISLLLYFTIM
jgi:hypothetical protein